MNDAVVIRELATRRANLFRRDIKRRRQLYSRLNADRDALRDDFNTLRYSDYAGPLADAVLAWADPATLPDVVCQGKRVRRLNKWGIAYGHAAMFAVQRGYGFGRFYRTLLGLTQSGWPSLLRSNVMHHWIGRKVRTPEERKARLREIQAGIRGLFDAANSTAGPAPAILNAASSFSAGDS